MATVTAHSNSAADVNDAIANHAGDGDTVIVPTGTGTVTWDQTITIPNTKGIILQGPGTNPTPTSATNATFPLIVTSNKSTAIDITLENERAVSRVTGFKFLGSHPNATIQINGRGRGPSPNYYGGYRIDNCWLYGCTVGTGVHLWADDGEVTGLTDHCTFENLSNDEYVIRIREVYTAGVSGAFGYDAWLRAFSFGTSRFNFIEDCAFKQSSAYMRHYISSDGAGGKFVARYNTFNSSYTSQPDYVDAHGDGCGGLGTGCRGGEIYNNTFLGSASTVGRNIHLRGGQFLVYNNSFATLGAGSSLVHLTEYRCSVDDSYQVTNQHPLSAGVPIPCDDSDYATYHPVPGQIQGTYFWNNCIGATPYNPYVSPENWVRTYIVDGTDYWACTNLADAQSKGLSYTAYTYPHPLQGSAPVGTIVLSVR